MRGTCVGWFINVASSVPTVRWLVCWVAQSAHKHNDPSVHQCLQLRGKRRTGSILSWTLHTTTASHGSFCPCWESTSFFFSSQKRDILLCQKRAFVMELHAEDSLALCLPWSGMGARWRRERLPQWACARLRSVVETRILRSRFSACSCVGPESLTVSVRLQACFDVCDTNFLYPCKVVGARKHPTELDPSSWTLVS